MTLTARILSTLLLLTSLGLAGCARALPPIDLRATADSGSRGPVAVRVVVRSEHGRYAERFLAGAIETVQSIDAAYGGYGTPAIVLIDPDWRGNAAAVGDGTVMEPVRWWTTPTAMAPELAAARAVSRQFWARQLHSGRLPQWLIEALAELTARRATETLFSHDNLTPGYAFTELRYFGGFVPRFARIRILVETGGAANDAYRANPRVDLTSEPRSPSERSAQIGKAVLMLVTLERWVGRPVAQDIFRRLAERLRSAPAGLDDFERLASEVSGQNLAWLFDAAVRSADEFDYTIGGVESGREADEFAAAVTVRRDGAAQFTGMAGRPDGPFERGRGIRLQTTFADGEQRTDYWDGRERTKTFRYRSPAPIATAVVDPDRIDALDIRQTHNSAAAIDRPASAVATVWAVHFTSWLENLLLTFAALA